MSKKILAVVMAAAMAMTGLAGCQGKGTSTAATGGDNGAAPSAEATKITICVPDRSIGEGDCFLGGTGL